MIFHCRYTLSDSMNTKLLEVLSLKVPLSELEIYGLGLPLNSSSNTPELQNISLNQGLLINESVPNRKQAWVVIIKVN